MQPAARAMVKTVLLFDGMPGVGKTTHLERLRRALGAAWLSMARFAEARGLSREERWRHQSEQRRPHPVDLAFLEALDAVTEPFVLLEKFGRTRVEAQALVERSRTSGWRLEVIHLVFDGSSEHAVGGSVERQLARGLHHGRRVTEDEARRRAVAHLNGSSGGRARLAELGVPIHRVTCTAPLEENHARIREALGFDVRRVPFDEAPLRELHEVSRRLGIEAWASAGHLYRPFWNGRFGPAQWPSDVDVAVHEQAAVEPLLEALWRAFPSRRWSVMCPVARLWRKLGLRVASLHEAKAHAKLLHKAGAVRWSEERAEIEVQLADGAEGCLWSGTVRLNDRLLQATEGREVHAYALDAAGVERAVRDYPGLRVHVDTAARLGASAQAWSPRPEAGAAWRTLKAEVVRAHPPGSSPRARRRLTADERALAGEILALHLAGVTRAEDPGGPERSLHAVPRVDRVDWPEPLESLRRARERKKAGLRVTRVDEADVPPPHGWSSWLHHLGTNADDALFRDWFLHQSRHHAPVGGADPLVRGVLDGGHFANVLRHGTRLSLSQTAMHEGWTLPQHLAASVLTLETDALVARLRDEGHDDASLGEVRLSMRVAMLFHDVGKLVAPRASWRHGRIGARLWQRTHPDWFPRDGVALVAWLVEGHDLFGAFARWLTEGTAGGDFRGAVDAQALRSGLRRSGLPFSLAVALNAAVWRADVGSVAALRWLLPVAERVERIALSGDGAEPGPRERRRRPRAAVAEAEEPPALAAR